MSSKKTVEIRPATPEDVPAVVQFIRDLATFEKLRDKCLVDEELLRKAAFGPRPYCEIVIPSVEGQVVGFALFFHNYSTFTGKPGIYLEDLYVKEEARHFGVGTAVLKYLARLAVERDCTRVDWQALDWNENAINFYRKVGARSLDDWITFRLDGDALLRYASS
ncbi:N-acetyltransferase GCN5 [Polychytrium aggregatum]|uniref:N-acetyltransferase GCN5 n=1 Tax=Polychytrium aggregatum TaxID=110093 RepID=UPI0022FECC19|nr:N-acetyltransferase GCN5 [Polychytrium aggregatum]KAI9208135.1 N-acetyltransferase GCN5 [Polychytrium aggregatum]